MKMIIQPWNFLRVLRLVLGIAVIADGIFSRNILIVVLGTVLAVMALANKGCCTANGCVVNNNTNSKTNTKNEELDP